MQGSTLPEIVHYVSDHRDLEARWLAGDEEAAAALAAWMTPTALRRFGTEALAACCESTKAPLAVSHVVTVGRDDPSSGHAAFDAVRRLILKAEAKVGGAAPPLLYAAEHVARVIYNSTSPDDPFDADADRYALLLLATFWRSLKLEARGQLQQQFHRLLEAARPRRFAPVDARSIRLSKLELRWLTGDPETCRALVGEMIEAQLRVFAVDALSACCAIAPNVPPPVLRVLEAGGSAPDSARVAFGAVHELTSVPDVSLAMTLDVRLLRVAESAARVIYNSTKPEDAFDRSSGEWLLQSIAGFHYAASPNAVRQQLGARLRHALVTATSMVPPSRQGYDARTVGIH